MLAKHQSMAFGVSVAPAKDFGSFLDICPACSQSRADAQPFNVTKPPSSTGASGRMSKLTLIRRQRWQVPLVIPKPPAQRVVQAGTTRGSISQEPASNAEHASGRLAEGNNLPRLVQSKNGKKQVRPPSGKASVTRIWRRGAPAPLPPDPLPIETTPKVQIQTSIEVTNLPSDSSQTEVETYFDRFGPLDGVELISSSKGNPTGVVRFLEPWASESAAEAVRKANGATWKNCRLRVGFVLVDGEDQEAISGVKQRENGRNDRVAETVEGQRGAWTSNRDGVSESSGVQIKSRDIGTSVPTYGWNTQREVGASESLDTSVPEGAGAALRSNADLSRNPRPGSQAEEVGLSGRVSTEQIRSQIQQLARDKPVDARKAERLFSGLQQPGELDYTALLAVYAQAAEKHKARALFEQMCDRGFRPSRLAFHNLLQAYCNSGAIQSATSLLAEMEANGVPPDGTTYSFFVLYYARAKNRQKVLEVFDTTRRLGLAVPPSVYSAAINAHIQSRQMRPAADLFAQMESAHMRIPIGAFNAILDGYASTGDERGALHVFRKLKAAGIEPSVITFGGLLKLYTRKGEMASATRVVAEMVAAGIAHSKQTHSMLISGHAGAGDVEAAYAAFQDMARSRNRPDVIAYTAIITCFARSAQMDRAYDMLKSMEQEGLRPNNYTYTALIDGWARQGDLPKAMEAVRAMRASGTLPTVATFTCIVSALAKTGQMTKAVKVIDEMRKLNVAPDTRLYAVLIGGYANIGDVHNAFEVFQRVKAEGFPMDKRIYSTLINACAKVGRMQSAVAVVGEMRALGIEADIITYNTLLDGWAKRGDVWEAADVIEQMQAAGVRPDTTSFCLLIYACMKASDMNKALSIVQEMERLGLKPTLEIYSVLIEGWCQVGEPERALSVFAHLKREGLTPDYPAYHCLMSGLLTSGDVSHVRDDVILLADEMVEQGYVADESTARFWTKQLTLAKREMSGTDFSELATAVRQVFPVSFRTNPDAGAESAYRETGSSSAESSYQQAGSFGSESGYQQAGTSLTDSGLVNSASRSTEGVATEQRSDSAESAGFDGRLGVEERRSGRVSSARRFGVSGIGWERDSVRAGEGRGAQKPVLSDSGSSSETAPVGRVPPGRSETGGEPFGRNRTGQTTAREGTFGRETNRRSPSNDRTTFVREWSGQVAVREYQSERNVGPKRNPSSRNVYRPDVRREGEERRLGQKEANRRKEAFAPGFRAKFDDFGGFAEAGNGTERTETERNGENGTERNGREEPNRGVWRNAKQKRALEASKALEAEYSKTRLEEMVTFLTHTEQAEFGAGYERIDLASLLVKEGSEENLGDNT